MSERVIDIAKKRYVKPAAPVRQARMRTDMQADNIEPLAAFRSLVERPSTDLAPQPVSEQIEEPAHDFMADFGQVRAGLARRRRVRLLNAVTRFSVFLALPTFMAWTYFADMATPHYAAESTFVIKAGDGSAQGAGGLAQTMSASGTAHDAMAVQGWLESRNALDRLETDRGFSDIFASEVMDPLQRLAPDATREDIFELYQKKVTIGFDPTEGIVKLKVLSPDPALSQAWSESLIGYAQERVEAMTVRIREDRLKSASLNLDDAQEQLRLATADLVALQEEAALLSAPGEERIVADGLSGLETQLGDVRMERDIILQNRRPNAARLSVMDSRLASLEAEIGRRREMTVTGSGTSSAAALGRIEIARNEVENRRELRSEAMRQMEAARADATRQSRYVTIGVAPMATDEPYTPKPAQDTLVFFLALLAVYGGVSLTAAMIKDQITA
jgi:capsular polysaccharide transport system permease protein